jgi:light-regulated signal transduction histidine kinase (bacteriophytochrome)
MEHDLISSEAAENVPWPMSSLTLRQQPLSEKGELDLVCHALAHDLRGPLRAINSCAKLLRASLMGRLDADEAARLQILIQASQLEGRLLDALLLLCRIARLDLKMEEVDVSKLSEKILDQLVKTQPSRKRQLNITPGLMALGDPLLLEIAFRHLLENAWKFTSREKETSIEMGAVKLDGRIVLYVRDNGVGFDGSQSGKMFGIFERLETAGDFAGVGIGLAIVKRIVDRHGGSIWAKSENGKGATFWFTFFSPPIPA